MEPPLYHSTISNYLNKQLFSFFFFFFPLFLSFFSFFSSFLLLLFFFPTLACFHCPLRPLAISLSLSLSTRRPTPSASPGGAAPPLWYAGRGGGRGGRGGVRLLSPPASGEPRAALPLPCSLRGGGRHRAHPGGGNGGRRAIPSTTTNKSAAKGTEPTTSSAGRSKSTATASKSAPMLQLEPCVKFLADLKAEKVYHSSFIDDDSITKACGCPLLPLKTHIKGPAPASDPDKADIVDEAITFFRANVFFKNFHVKSPADKLLIYLTFYINIALKRLEGCRTLAVGTKAIINLGLEKVPVPGEPGFPFPGLFTLPLSQEEAELLRNYLKQIREETSGRLLSCAYRANGFPNKWWLAFAKRKFMNIVIL